MLKAREIRERQGKSLEDVVRLTSISAGHLSRFETGVARLSQEKLQELAATLGVTIDELLAPAEPAAAVASTKEEMSV